MILDHKGRGRVVGVDVGSMRVLLGCWKQHVERDESTGPFMVNQKERARYASKLVIHFYFFLFADNRKVVCQSGQQSRA